MSHKAPKKYGKAASKPIKSEVTEADTRQALRIITGIIVGLFAICAVLCACYAWFSR